MDKDKDTETIPLILLALQSGSCSLALSSEGGTGQAGRLAGRAAPLGPS